MLRATIIVAVMILAACGDDRPPAPTAEQSDQLNEAEELLNREAANEASQKEGPEDRAPGSSR